VQFSALDPHTGRARVTLVDSFEAALHEFVRWGTRRATPRPLTIWLGGAVCRGVAGVLPTGTAIDRRDHRIREIIVSRKYSLESRFEFRWEMMDASNGLFWGAAIPEDMLGRLRDILSMHFWIIQPFIRIKPLWLEVFYNIQANSNGDGYYSICESDSMNVLVISGGKLNNHQLKLVGLDCGLKVRIRVA
jgi:hypothetical protein